LNKYIKYNFRGYRCGTTPMGVVKRQEICAASAGSHTIFRVGVTCSLVKRYQPFSEIWRFRLQNFYKGARIEVPESALFFERHISMFLLNITEINRLVE